MDAILTRYIIGRFGWLLARGEYQVELIEDKRSGK